MPLSKDNIDLSQNVALKGTRVTNKSNKNTCTFKWCSIRINKFHVIFFSNHQK